MKAPLRAFRSTSRPNKHRSLRSLNNHSLSHRVGRQDRIWRLLRGLAGTDGGCGILGDSRGIARRLETLRALQRVVGRLGDQTTRRDLLQQSKAACARSPRSRSSVAGTLRSSIGMARPPVGPRRRRTKAPRAHAWVEHGRWTGPTRCWQRNENQNCIAAFLATCGLPGAGKRTSAFPPGDGARGGDQNR
jgi:hypothetical protein